MRAVTSLPLSLMVITGSLFHEVLLVAPAVLDPLAEKILQPDVDFLWRLQAGLQGSELQALSL